MQASSRGRLVSVKIRDQCPTASDAVFNQVNEAMQRWFVYLIECRDESIYTGIATDVARRYAMHAAGKGARYTRSRPPRRLLGSFEFPDRSSASRAEHAIKQLTPAQKRAICLECRPPAAMVALRGVPA